MFSSALYRAGENIYEFTFIIIVSEAIYKFKKYSN